MALLDFRGEVTRAVDAPITGRETVRDRWTPFAALVAFYAAFNGRDLAAMAANWAQRDDSVMSNPVGDIKRGWKQIAAVYERIFTGPAEVYVELWDYTLHEGLDVFYAVGQERGHYRRGSETIELVIRTTRVFQRLDGRWKQVHHHGSIDDATALARYQAAVLTPGRAEP